MNRKMTELALMTICKRLADRYLLNIVTVKDPNCGLWDCKDFTNMDDTFTNYLTKKYGKFYETHFTSVPYEEYDLRKDFKISFEHRFGNPKICIGTQWGEDGYACMEFSPNSNDEDADYVISELLVFKESGLKYQRILLREWRDMVKMFGVDG